MSSVEGRPVPFTCDFEVKPVMGPSSLGTDADGFSGVRWPLASADCADGDSCGLNLALSRSIALSLAARGAAGKNWAKLAPAGRVMARRGVYYRSRRPPTIISGAGDAGDHHAWASMKLNCRCWECCAQWPFHATELCRQAAVVAGLRRRLGAAERVRHGE